MRKLLEVDYLEMQDRFKEAEVQCNRLRLGDIETNEWLQNENICESKFMTICKQFPDPRIFIIAAGEDKGLYIYSKQQKVCVKYDNSFSVAKVEE